MAELILIRHAQANASGENYDELTELGHEQARKIGQWLKFAAFDFDYLVHGGLKRQKQTLENIAAEIGTAARSGQPEIHQAFAEFDLRVFGILAADMRHGRPDFAEVLKEWNSVRKEDSPDKGVVFKKLMALVLGEWVKRGESFSGGESFPAFRQKVLSALDIPLKKPGRYLAVTSGGPISMLTGQVLGLDLQQTLGLMRRIYNTSVHHFIHTNGRWELISFNSLPHLAASERTLV